MLCDAWKLEMFVGANNGLGWSIQPDDCRSALSLGPSCLTCFIDGWTKFGDFCGVHKGYMILRLDLSAESAAIQQCFSLTTNQRTVLSAQ
jgi:hypothetical protein